MLVRAIAAALMLLLSVNSANARDLILLSAPSSADNADRALVLVHGLLGRPDSSFGKWPQLIASDSTQLPGHGRMSDFAIYAVDYSANFDSQGTLEDIANSVAEDIAASVVFRRHRQVWIVAHSMGGLVVKRSFARWNAQQKTLIIDRIVGVGLLGVPSAGAPLADLTSKLGAAAVARLLGWNGDLLRDLTTDSGRRYLAGIENDWTSFMASRNGGAVRRLTPLVHCGYETKPESGILSTTLGDQYSIIVPKLFASTICDAVRGLAGSHTQLPKPTDANAESIGWLRNLIVLSAARALLEERTALTTAPTHPSSLANRVRQQNEDLRQIDLPTGLVAHPEEISFVDAQSQALAATLALRGGPFTASTKANLYERIAEANQCLAVKLSSNRLNIFLQVVAPLRACGASQLSVCPGLPCD